MNELELIKRCLKKEKKAWDVFVRKYSRVIYWAIKRRLGLSGFRFNQDDINGIFQEVFLSILENDRLRQVKDARTISGWLAMLAANKTIDFMRYASYEKGKLVAGMPVLKDDNLEQELQHRDLLEAIGNSINKLSAKARVVISLNLLEGRSHQEIAGMMNLSVNTVSTTIARSKEKLKQDLETKGIKDF